MLQAALTAGLTAAGCDVILLQIVSTPGVALMIRHLDCHGGVVITASHNPIAYNGIKFLSANGIAYPAHEVKEIHRRYHERDFHSRDALGCGTVTESSKTHAVHVDTALAAV